MSSVDSRQSKWSVQVSRAPGYKEPKTADASMYPAQRRKRGRPRKERKPLGYRHNQPLPPAPVAHSTRSRSTRSSVVSSTPAASAMESVPSSTDNLEPGMDALNYAPVKTWSASSKELMPPPREPVKRRLESVQSTDHGSVQPSKVPTKRRAAKPPSTSSQDVPSLQYTDSEHDSSGSSSSSSSYMYPEARGEKRVHTKVPKAE